ncbi:MAG: J domain-containing protein [Thiofilum sp.]|uniref:J domain-containing protein n=1 Tax=Thiofilum sp. TaxID=2212733 RepID=UPI0025F5BD38|nr:J domain-containing protein [Thiofilum sp.]MBK8452181.1 J domain-containing protein [Thiofilum sp.]
MSFWDELGIEATNDKKLIKKAYAKRLKVTRPEENAAAFQELYNAYQRALSYADYYHDEVEYEDEVSSVNDVAPLDSVPSSELELESSSKTSDPQTYTVNLEKPALEAEPLTPITQVLAPPPIPQPELSVEDTSSSFLLSAPSTVMDANYEQQEGANSDENGENGKNEENALPSVEQQLEQEWLHTQAWLEQLLADPHEANRLLNWNFLKRSPLLQDLEWRTRVSTYVFEEVAGVNYESLNNTELPPNTLYIKAHILNYLDRLLDWEKSWQYLRVNYSEAYLDSVFNYLTSNEPSEQQAEPILLNQSEKKISWLQRIVDIIRYIFAIYINFIIANLLIGAGMAFSPHLAIGILIFIVYVYITGGRFIKWIALGHTVMGLKYGKS